MSAAPPAHAQKQAPAKHAQAAPKSAVGSTKWSDPKEGAFSVDVPTGWQVAGGIKRDGPLDVWQSLIVQSADKNITLVVGDVSLPTFVVIGSFDRDIGAQEGHAPPSNGNFQSVYQHYMTGTEFNKQYLEKGLSQVVNDVAVGTSRDLPEAAQKALAAASRQVADAHIKMQVSVGITEFTGKDKTTGLGVSGALLTTTQYLHDSDPRDGGGGGGGTASGGSSASMAAYWRHNAQRQEQQHQFVNYLRDEKNAVALDGSVVQIPDR